MILIKDSNKFLLYNVPKINLGIFRHLVFYFDMEYIKQYDDSYIIFFDRNQTLLYEDWLAGRNPQYCINKSLVVFEV